VPHVRVDEEDLAELELRETDGEIDRRDRLSLTGDRGGDDERARRAVRVHHHELVPQAADLLGPEALRIVDADQEWIEGLLDDHERIVTPDEGALDGLVASLPLAEPEHRGG
jgi:hypothetical protein